MNEDSQRMRVSLKQMGRLILALEDLKVSVLPKDPKLFATLAEGPLDQMSKIRLELDEYHRELQPTA